MLLFTGLLLSLFVTTASSFKYRSEYGIDSGQPVTQQPLDDPRLATTLDEERPMDGGLEFLGHSTEVDERTVYQFLNSTPGFSLVSKAINFAGNETISLLNNTSSSVTFFATPDKALRRPHRRHALDLDSLFESSSMLSHDLEDILVAIEALEMSSATDDLNNDRREILRKIVQSILAYSTLPEAYSAAQLSHNATFATNISFLGLDGEPMRIRTNTRIVPPSLRLNLYSKVIHPNRQMANGYVHVVNHPLLPPLPTFNGLFNFPGPFSTLTSAVQHAGLEDNIGFRFQPGDDGKGTWNGSTSVTVFAPTNLAFARLPWRLRAWLFSPFGSKALKKLLQYHIVPSMVFHADYVYNATSQSVVTGETKKSWQHDQSHAGLPHEHCSRHIGRLDRPAADKLGLGLLNPSLEVEHEDRVERRHPPHGPHGTHGIGKTVEVTRYTFDTLASYPVNVTVARIDLKIPIHKVPDITKWKVRVNGHAIALRDVPSGNGVIHVVDRLIVPRRHHHHGHRHHAQGDDKVGKAHYDEWEGWEEWLPAWANEN